MGACNDEKAYGMLQGNEDQASRKAGGYNNGTQSLFTNNGPGGQNFGHVNYSSDNTYGDGNTSIVNNKNGGPGNEAQASQKVGGYNNGTHNSFINNGPGGQNFGQVNYINGHTYGGGNGSIVNKKIGGPGNEAQASRMAVSYFSGTQGSFTNNGPGGQNFGHVNYNSGYTYDDGNGSIVNHKNGRPGNEALASQMAGGYYSGIQGSFTNNGPGGQNFGDVNYNGGYTYGSDKGSIVKNKNVRSNKK